MHSKPTRQTPKTSSQFRKPVKTATKPKSAQHGLLSPDCPSETINWVTSYLLPKELFALSRVSKHLYNHVSQEATWRSAFASFFLGMDPEAQWGKHALLRRSESTWKREFVQRYRIMKYVLRLFEFHWWNTYQGL